VSPPLTVLGAPVLGLALGMTGAFIHASRTVVFGVSVPWGLALSMACVVACIRATVILSGRRTAGVLLWAGWLVVTVMAAVSTAAGDLPIQMTWRSLTYLVGTAMIGSATMVFPAPAASAAREPVLSSTESP
jgi:hypothetical protein